MLHVCFTGVESTGKSTMAEQLSLSLGGVVMPEYGREYAETIGTDFTPEALRMIASEHQRRRHAMVARCPTLLIEDTDIVTTAAWFRMLHFHRDPMLSAIPAGADLYLLFAPDTPWVADGTRQFVGTERMRFQRVIENELALRGIAPVVVSGDWAQRRAQAEAVICAALATREALS